ncbi:MAG TPA: prolyl oligopeptidase family serine peptidase [Candidatus Dormibacteraeota bacterium]|nr:prolyl oligopeptidase family serine peptidase [Candidatus Dormibacteraeota bacterium]
MSRGTSLAAAAGLLWLAAALHATPPAASGAPTDGASVDKPRAALAYPPAPRAAVVEKLHGVKVADPYRPLEELDAPATRAWVGAQAQLTQRYFATLSGREALRVRIAALYEFQKHGVPFQEGGRYFFTYNSGRENQSVLRVSANPVELGRVVLDPNQLPAEGNPVVTGYRANRAGTLLAYAVSLSGSDWTDWHLRELASGRDLPDVLRFTKYYPPVFTPDGRGLYYSAFPAPRAGAELSSQDRGNAVYYHALGTPSSEDSVVLADAAHPDWQFEPQLSNDGRWLIVRSGEGQVGDKGREDLYLLDLSRVAAGAPAPKASAIASGFEAAYSFAGDADGWLYFLTSLGAPNGRVVAIDPLRPAREHWREVIAPGPDAIDLAGRGVTLVHRQLIVRTLHDASSRVTRYALDGTGRREVALPGAGSVSGFEGHSEDQETFYTFTDLVTPPTVYRYDMRSGLSSVVDAPRVAFAPGAFEQRQVFYPARDGTRIPLLLAYRKGLNLGGDNPLLLYGYGGFGQAILPTFNPARIAWLEMGGVFAIANVRGGGEYGESWHRAGIGIHRQVVFDDFIAAAEYLIAQRYTSVRRLAIHGRSNGGLLVGACLTQRPDLFGAAIAQVGVLDMLRFNRFGQGAGWEGDYGSPADPEQFRALYAYSPVHNVRAGTRYPPTLIITGDHDTRVMPMHSFKFAAALQAAQAGTAPVLLAVDLASGHSGGETTAQAIAQSADIYAFLRANLDMAGR